MTPEDKSPLVELLRWISDNPQAPYDVMGIIACVFAALLIWFIGRLSTAERDVRGLNGLVSSGNIDALVREVRSSGADLAGSLLAQAGLDEKSPLARRLRQYCDGFLPLEAETKPRTARTAGEVFDFDSLVRETLNIRLLQAVPNVLVGIGLLFTFLGLSAALYFASQGAASSDIVRTQASLHSLLEAATFKFSSSLIALLLSIVFLFTERVKLRAYQQHVLAFSTSLDRAFPSLSTEELLGSLLASRHLDRNANALLSASSVAFSDALDAELGSASQQVRAYLADVRSIRQTGEAQLEALREIGPSVARQLDATLGVRVSETFGRLDETIESIGKTMYKANEKVLKKILDDFSKGLELRTRESFEAMVAASGEFTEAVTVQAKAMGAATAKTGSLIEELVAEGKNGLALLLEATAALDELVESATNGGTSIAAAAAPLEGVALSAASMLQQLASSHESLSTGVSKVIGAAEAVERSTSRSADANRLATQEFTGRLEEATRIFQQSIGDLTVEVTKRFANVVADVDRSTEALRVLARENASRRDDAASRFSADVGRLEGELKVLSQSIRGGAFVVASNGASEGQGR